MNLYRYSTILVLSLSLTACGGKKDPVNANPSLQDMDSHWVVSGELSQYVDEISKSEYAFECDIAFHQMRLELASAVDKKQAELAANPESNKTSDSEKLIPFHGSFLTDEPVPTPSKLGWQSYRTGWTKLYRYYKANVKKPGKSFWANMNTSVRSLISDDLSRIDGRNMEIGKDEVDLLPGLLSTLNQCLAKETCAEPAFSAEQLQLIERVNKYYWWMEDLKAAKDLSSKREELKGFAVRVAKDAELSSSRINESIVAKKTEKGTELEIPFIAPGFSKEDLETVTQYFERAWTSEKLSVKVKFKDTESPTFFKLFFDNEPGARAYVYRKNKEMHLVPYTATSSLPHELGHALGFADHYYSVWDSGNCDYTVQYRNDDIMSNHSTNMVTKEEWEWLEKSYPVK